MSGWITISTRRPALGPLIDFFTTRNAGWRTCTASVIVAVVEPHATGSDGYRISSPTSTVTVSLSDLS